MARKPIVLFVDDEPLTRRIYQYRFLSLGIPHYVVDSAEAAVQIMEENRVDVVVTDLFMPRYSGKDLITCVRECPQTQSLPIILFTTGGDPEKVTQALQAGATEMLAKQTTPPDRLVERIYALTRDVGEPAAQLAPRA